MSITQDYENDIKNYLKFERECEEFKEKIESLVEPVMPNGDIISFDCMKKYESKLKDYKDKVKNFDTKISENRKTMEDIRKKFLEKIKIQNKWIKFGDHMVCMYKDLNEQTAVKSGLQIRFSEYDRYAKPIQDIDVEISDVDIDT